MRLPFGLDLVSMIVGALIALYVLPWLFGMFSRGKATAAKA